MLVAAKEHATNTWLLRDCVDHVIRPQTSNSAQQAEDPCSASFLGSKRDTARICC